MIGRRDFFFFVSGLLLSILTPVFLINFLVFLCVISFLLFLILDGRQTKRTPMRECLGKHSCMSSPFPIAILNGTLFFREAKYALIWAKLRLSKSYHTTTSICLHENLSGYIRGLRGRTECHTDIQLG